MTACMCTVTKTGQTPALLPQEVYCLCFPLEPVALGPKKATDGAANYVVIKGKKVTSISLKDFHILFD